MEKKQKQKEEETLLELIDETPILSKQGIFKPQSDILLSKSAALASISTKISNLVEEEIDHKLEDLGARWKELVTKKNRELFESLKQIIVHLGWPKNLVKKQNGDSLIWKINKNRFGFSIEDFQINEEKNLQNLEYTAIFSPFLQRSKWTSLLIQFPQPSPHHTRTIERLIEDVTFQAETKETESELQIYAPTFYECWTKAYLATLVASYKISRYALQTGNKERALLQSFTVPSAPAHILKQISFEIRSYQLIGSRFAQNQTEMTSEKEDILAQTEKSKKTKEEKKSELKVTKSTQKEKELEKRGKELIKSISQAKKETGSSVLRPQIIR